MDIVEKQEILGLKVVYAKTVHVKKYSKVEIKSYCPYDCIYSNYRSGYAAIFIS